MTEPATGERRHPALIGALSIVGALVLLIATGVAVVRGAHSAAGSTGLSYTALGADLRAAFHFVPVERWVRVDTVRVRVGDRDATVDTLVVVADTSRYPSFRRGGFLHDHVRTFNRHQRFRLELAAHSAALFDTLAQHNPSLFRTGRTERGLPIVLPIANVYPMRVASPFEELWRGRVLAAESPAVPAFAARDGITPLHRAGAGPDAPCRIERDASLVRFYCASRERRPQLILRLAANDAAVATGRVGWSPRNTPFRYDGAVGEAGDTVALRGGGILSVAGLTPGVFALVEPGLISGTQWINGRVRRVDAGPPGLAALSALGTRAAAQGARGGRDVELRLSVDAELSRMLSDSLTAAARGLPLDGAAAALIDAATGEVIALAETGSRLTPDAGWLTRPVSVGSAVKPLLAAAILSQRPELATLRIPAEAVVTHLFGLPVGRFESNLNCGMPSDGWIDLRYFIRCSSNQYAAALVLAGVADGAETGTTLADGPSAPFELRGRRHVNRRPAIPLVQGRVPRDHLTSSALADGLLRSFNLDADILVSDSRGRNGALWSGLHYSNGVALRAPKSLQPEVSRPSLVARAEDGTPPSLLATYAYGGWGNQWTLLDLAQGYARLLTSRRVIVSFAPGGVRDGGDATNEAERYGAPMGWARRPWYRALTDALAEVSESGTAAGLGARWRAQLGDDAVIYAKTGTLNEGDDRLYLRALAFGVGRRDLRGGAALQCGIVGVVYFKLRELPAGAVTLPPLHTDFANGVMGEILRRRWERRSPCDPKATDSRAAPPR